MKKYLYTIMAAVAMLASCTKESPSDIQSEVTEHAAKGITTIGVSTDATTKAVVSTEDNTEVLWETGDALAAFSNIKSDDPYEDGMVNKKVVYVLRDGSGTTSGTFEMEEDPQVPGVNKIYTIVYPKEAFVAAYGTYGRRDHIRCTIPTVQTARKGSFDKAAAVMYALPESSVFSEDDLANIRLKYAVNFLKVTVSESEKVESIKISSSKALTGTVEISNDGIQPGSSNTENYVVLKAEDGQTMEPGDYYIAVMPGTIEKPVITYKSNHSIRTKAGSGSITFAEGTNVKPIKVDFSKGDVTGAVQLWANGPYWSVKNVGATSIYDPGFYFSWGNTTGYVRNSKDDGWVVAPGYSGAGKALSGGFSLTNYAKSAAWNISRNLQANASEDAAVAAWGSDWRMPTKAEIDGFTDKVTSALSGDETYYTVKGKGEYSNDFIILPAGGNGYNDSHEPGWIACCSWTSTFAKNSSGDHKPYYLILSRMNPIPQNDSILALRGLNIRPVLVNTDF